MPPRLCWPWGRMCLLIKLIFSVIRIYDGATICRRENGLREYMGQVANKSSTFSKKFLILPIALSLTAHVLLISATGLVDMHAADQKHETAITVNLQKAADKSTKAANKEGNVKKAAPLPEAAVVVDNDPVEEREETVSIDSDDEQYALYLQKIKKIIESIWSYPRQAYIRRKEGVSTVKFSLEKSGALVAIKIVKSSGYELLDRETIRVINASAPFDPFPETIHFSKLHILATFQYRLTE